MKNVLVIIDQHMQEAPVDVEAMAEDMGIAVVRKFWEDHLSGSIEKTDDGYKISVNFFHNRNRQRYTIAHEIGHFILHKEVLDKNESIVDGEAGSRLYRDERISSDLETEANRFAATILMPTELVKRLYDEGHTTPEKMAEKLQVSEDAMKYRMQNMGLL